MWRLSGDVAAGAAQSWINFKPKNSPQAITSKNAFSSSESWSDENSAVLPPLESWQKTMEQGPELLE